MARSDSARGTARDGDRSKRQDGTLEQRIEVSEQEILEEAPEDIADRAAGLGRERLDRSVLDIFITGLIGGTEVSLGGLAAMTVVGAALHTLGPRELPAALALGGLAFPLGFLFVILGRSELFTENFLIPVLSVFNRERSLASLAVLWALSWLGNLIACGIMAALLSQHQAVGETIIDGYRAYTEHKLAVSPLGIFYSGVLAGLAMTALTWLLVSVRDAVVRVVAIFATGYLLFAANLAHSIVSASLLLVGAGPAGRPLADVAVYLAVATLGNLVGGIGSVTFYRFLQVKERQRSG